MLHKSVGAGGIRTRISQPRGARAGRNRALLPLGVLKLLRARPAAISSRSSFRRADSSEGILLPFTGRADDKAVRPVPGGSTPGALPLKATAPCQSCMLLSSRVYKRRNLWNLRLWAKGVWLTTRRMDGARSLASKRLREQDT